MHFHLSDRLSIINAGVMLKTSEPVIKQPWVMHSNYCHSNDLRKILFTFILSWGHQMPVSQTEYKYGPSVTASSISFVFITI